MVTNRIDPLTAWVKRTADKIGFIQAPATVRHFPKCKCHESDKKPLYGYRHYTGGPLLCGVRHDPHSPRICGTEIAPAIPKEPSTKSEEAAP